MNCENCDNEHDGSYGSRRFCSSKCARGFSTKRKRSLINEKIRKTIEDKHPKIEKNCEWCGNKFEVKKSKKKQLTCSRSCSAKLRNNSPEYKEWLSEHFSKIAKKRYMEGDESIGWQIRKNQPMSKPERIVKKFLDEENIIFEREYKEGKYFIDFAILERQISLEIDGKQHNYPERRKKDKEKDEFLRSRGWKIIRYPFIDYDDLEKKKKEIIALLV
jgi:very-short-patch-repair endonuclease